MILTWGKQERPAGLSTLEQVLEAKAAAEAAATTAAADAFDAAQPQIAQAIADGAAGAAIAAAEAVAPAAADAIRAQVAADADRAEAGRLAAEAAVDGKVDKSDWDGDFIAALVDDAGTAIAGVRDRDGVASWEAPEMRADTMRSAEGYLDRGLIGGSVIEDADTDAAAFALLSESGQIMAALRDRGGIPSWEAPEVRAERGTFGGAVIVDDPDYESDAALVIIDSQGRIGLSVGTPTPDNPDPPPEPEPVAAPYISGEGLLRITRQRRIARTLNLDTQLVIAHIGDSWTFNWNYWAKGWADILAERYGDAGEGWIGFGRKDYSTSPHGSARRRATPTYSSNWSFIYSGAVSPDLTSATATTAGEWIAVTLPAGTTGATLFALGSADGQARYQIDGGAWSALPLVGSGPMFVPLAGITGANAVRIEVVSGSVTLLGIDAVSTAPGVRVHKLGASGSNLGHWVGIDAAGWQSQIAQLAPNLVSILHGTNDQNGGDTSLYAQRLTELVGRVRTALPYADLLIVAPPENAMGRPSPMSGFQDAAYQTAVELGTAYLNLQDAFGPEPSFYDDTGTGFLSADDVHPSPIGGQAIIGSLLEITNL